MAKLETFNILESRLKCKKDNLWNTILIFSLIAWESIGIAILTPTKKKAQTPP